MKPRAIKQKYSSVECQSVVITIDPEPDVIHQHTDYFGNEVTSFSIESLHQSLAVVVNSELTVHQHGLPPDAQLPWEKVTENIRKFEDHRWFEAQAYLQESPRVRRGKRFANYAKESFLTGRSLSEAMLNLTERIHHDFQYDTSATHVHSTTEEAFDLRAGVCQDFAHIQIACLRSIGLPARYVSGYLRTATAPGEQRMLGADESHAWVSLYGGEKLGWIDFDPTNACICDTNHIPICVGRDYGDVSPMRGVVVGGGNTELKVSVDVESMDEPAQTTDFESPLR